MILFENPQRDVFIVELLSKTVHVPTLIVASFVGDFFPVMSLVLGHSEMDS